MASILGLGKIHYKRLILFILPYDSNDARNSSWPHGYECLGIYLTTFK
jgi:hypothetical protein